VQPCRNGAIRYVLITAPYFHDGSQATLWDVLDHYNHGDGVKDPWLDEDMQPLALSESEINDLVDFLAALTSSQYQQLGAKVTDVEPPCNGGSLQDVLNRYRRGLEFWGVTAI
jgi:cytochrome c peroxidase